MAITSQQKEHLVALTTVMFNAPPGARYLKEFAGDVEAGTSLEQLAVNLAATEAFKSQFSSLTSQDARIDKVLDNLGLTSGTPAYQEAYTFFDTRLDAGADPGRLLLEAGKYLYTTDDPTFSDAAALYRNKIDAGVYHSVTLGMESSSVEALQDAIAGVTQAPESVARVKERLDSVAAGSGNEGDEAAAGGGAGSASPGGGSTADGGSSTGSSSSGTISPPEGSGNQFTLTQGLLAEHELVPSSMEQSISSVSSMTTDEVDLGGSATTSDDASLVPGVEGNYEDDPSSMVGIKALGEFDSFL